MTNHRIMALSKSKLSAGSAAILLLAALSTNAVAQNAPNKDYSLTIMGFNIWNNGAASKMWDAEAKQNGELVYIQATKDLLLGVAPDVLVMPELYNNRGKIFNGLDVSQAHIANTLETLNLIPNKLGEYTKNADYQSGTDNGLVFTSGPSETLKYNTVKISPGNGFPDTVIEGVHLNYYDEPTNRISQVKQLTEDAKKRAGPTIIAGDLNAGDLTERGLLSIRGQLQTIRNAAGSALYEDLANQYLAAGNEALSMQIIQDAFPGQEIDSLTWEERGEALENAYKEGKDIGLIDETYAVASNQPQTMNILKQNFQLLQLDRNREIYQPSVMEDQRATWTSDGEDATNTWASWDRVNIDHILISRPFGKWVEIIDNGDMSGTLAGPARLPDGGSLSDHEPVAQELRWIGPKLETYLEGDTEKSKVIWGADASRFSANNKEFYLTRNNYRDDVYLGQIADADGKPILTELSLDEKKTLLDCAGDDPRFAQAVQDYCIDDHSFIGKLQVTDGGTVIVEEDAALGNSTADLILEDGGLRVAGTDMSTLDRRVILEGSGWIDVADQDNNLTASQEISGDGALIKRGAGVLTLNGSHTYTGGTFVENGDLVVGSDGNETASILSDVNIGLNGSLGGIGTIGGLNVAKGGVITPGNSIGTLQVAGDATFAAGSLYHLEIDAGGNSDSIAVEGSATINGANVYVDMAQGDYIPGSRYSILTAGTGVTGTFGDISQSYLFVEFDFVYDPNEVFLEVMRNDVTFASLALTKNQNAVALPLEALGAGSELYDAFVQSQSRDDARQALDLLSGEIHASVKTGLINSSADLRNAAQDRIRSALGDKTSQAGMQVVSAEDARAALWLQTYGSWTETSATGNAAKFNQNTGGFFAGYDAEIGENARLGAMAGYSRSSFNVRDRASSGNANNYHLALYGGSRWGNTTVNGGIGYSRHTLDIDRAVWFSGVTDQLSSRYDAGTVQAFGEVSHKLQTDSVVFEPFANLSYVSVKTDNVWEKGGAAALAVKGDTTNVTFTTLGVRAETDIMLGETKASLHGALGWQHGFGDLQTNIEAAFAEGTAFVVSGVPVAKNSALVQVGFDIKASERTNLSINYSGQFGSNAQKNSVNAALGIKF